MVLIAAPRSLHLGGYRMASSLSGAERTSCAGGANFRIWRTPNFDGRRGRHFARRVSTS
jgi:hypothetical protein